ncbi:hypothetical protein [Duncaniella dubosii]|uniref:hypothetical protein n=1 Tax=Duncaniella dubosii TaxID=2518971 RepID=UPI003F662E04
MQQIGNPSAIEKYIQKALFPAQIIASEILLIFHILRLKSTVPLTLSKPDAASGSIRQRGNSPFRTLASNTDSTNGPRRFNPNGPLMHNDNLTSISSSISSSSIRNESGQTEIDEK